MRDRLFFIVSLCIFLVACRSDVPPKIEICLLDGVGGADCVETDGSKLYRSPSQLKNYWSTNEPDMQSFSSWCYKTTPNNVESTMGQIKAKVRGP